MREKRIRIENTEYIHRDKNLIKKTHMQTCVDNIVLFRRSDISMKQYHDTIEWLRLLYIIFTEYKVLFVKCIFIIALKHFKLCQEYGI